MSAKTYCVKLTFDTIYFSADLAQASAPIHIEDKEEGSTCTQYQTADAQHDEWNAAVLVVQSLGRDWWCSPDDDPEDEDKYIRKLIQSVEAEEDEEDGGDAA